MPNLTLSPEDEKEFRSWYQEKSSLAGIDPDPDAPEHKYDYRAAWMAGVGPVGEDGDLHWDSRFKAPDHPGRYVDGLDTKTNLRMRPQTLLAEDDVLGERKPIVEESITTGDAMVDLGIIRAEEEALKPRALDINGEEIGKTLALAKSLGMDFEFAFENREMILRMIKGRMTPALTGTMLYSPEGEGVEVESEERTPAQEIAAAMIKGGYEGMLAYLKMSHLASNDPQVYDTIRVYQTLSSRYDQTKKGPVWDALSGGFQSTVQSLTAGAPGALAGSIPAPVVGTVIGYALSAGSIFAAAEYWDTLEDARQAGLNIDDPLIRRAALINAIAEGGIETTTDLIGGKIFGFLGGAAKAGAKELAKDALHVFGRYLARVGKMGTVEIPGEMLTAAIQTATRIDAGIIKIPEGKTRGEVIWEAAKDAIGPSAVQVLLMGSAANAVSPEKKKTLSKEEQDDLLKKLDAAFKKMIDTNEGKAPPSDIKVEIPTEAEVQLDQAADDGAMAEAQPQLWEMSLEEADESIPASELVEERAAEIVERNPAEVRDIFFTISEVLRARLPEETVEKMMLTLKPLITEEAVLALQKSVDGSLEKSLAGHGLENLKDQIIGGLTYFNEQGAPSIWLSYNFDNQTVVGTLYHEIFHIYENAFLPDTDRQTLLQEYGSSEAVADAFRDWAIKKDAQIPNTGIQKIFEQIRQILTGIRDGLTGKGYDTPEKVFEAIWGKKYKEKAAEVPGRTQLKIQNPGININDSDQPFTEQILSGEKTIETRDSPSLDRYVGQRVGIVRTGAGGATLVGYAEIGQPKVYRSKAEFDADQDAHRVEPGSPYNFKGVKYGYPLLNVQPAEQRPITSRGIVARDISLSIVHLPDKGPRGGFVSLPAVFLRFGGIPSKGVSTNYLTNRPEKGVSVIGAWKDPKTGKYVLQEGGEDLINTIGQFTENALTPEEAYPPNVRKLYEVTGDSLSDVGGDEEPLLGNARTVREVSLDEVVTSADPWLTLSGKELEGDEIPDWSKAKDISLSIMKDRRQAPAGRGRGLGADLLARGWRLREDAGFKDKTPSVFQVAAHLGEQAANDKDGIGVIDGAFSDTATPEQNAAVENALRKFFRVAEKAFPESRDWDDADVERMFQMVAQVDPSVLTPENRIRFGLALAITSNGVEVKDNVPLAYEAWKNWTSGQGFRLVKKSAPRVAAMHKQMAMVETMESRFGGIIPLKDWMLTHAKVGDTVTELQQMLGMTRAKAKKMFPSELVTEEVPKAGIIGPKIGCWFANVMGDSDALTIDLWGVRTTGRIIGHTVKPATPEAIAKEQGRLRQALDSNPELAKKLGWTSGSNDDMLNSLARDVQDGSIEPDYRSEINAFSGGEEARKASNNLANLLSGGKIIDAPVSGSHRKWIRDRFRAAAKKEKVPVASFQATVWIGEKEVYRAAGARVPKAAYYSDGGRSLLGQFGIPDGGATGGAGDLGRGTSGSVARDLAEQGQSSGEVRRTEISLYVRKGKGGPQTEGSRSLRSLLQRSLADPSSLSKCYSREDEGDPQRPDVIYRPTPEAKTYLEQMGASSPSYIEVKDPQTFLNAISAAASANKHGAAVEVKSLEAYQDPGIRLFLTEAGDAGFALKSDGDIVSGFKHPESTMRSFSTSLLALAVEQGGTKGDCFDTVLPWKYVEVGLVVKSRVPWSEANKPPNWDYEEFKDFNDGRPDVVLMALDLGNDTDYAPGQGEMFPDPDKGWDQAAAHRDGFLAGTDAIKESRDISLSVLRKKPPPKKTIKAYKLYRIDKDGNLHSMFVQAEDIIPVGVWMDAEEGPRVGTKVKSKLGWLRFRPGLHAASQPIALQIGEKGPRGNKPAYRRGDEVWAEVELAADVDWQPAANAKADRIKKDSKISGLKKGDINPVTAQLEEIPVDGVYQYRTSNNVSKAETWYISGACKVVRILSDSEVAQINAPTGRSDLPKRPEISLDVRPSVRAAHLKAVKEALARGEKVPSRALLGHQELAEQYKATQDMEKVSSLKQGAIRRAMDRMGKQDREWTEEKIQEVIFTILALDESEAADVTKLINSTRAMEFASLVLEEEVRALERQAGVKGAKIQPMAMIKQVSGQQKIRDIVEVDTRTALRDQLKAEARTARDAFMAGKAQGSIQAKINQIQILRKAQAERAAKKEYKAMRDKLAKVYKIANKMSTEHRTAIKEILDSIDLTRFNYSKDKRIFLEKTTDWIVNHPNPDQIELPNGILAQLQKFHGQKTLADITLDDLRSIYTAVMTHVYYNIQEQILRVGNRNRLFAKALDEAVAEMRPAKAVAEEIFQSQENPDLKSKIRVIVDIFGIRQDRFDLIVDSIAGPNSVIGRVFLRNILAGREVQRKYRQKVFKQFQSSIEEIGIRDIDKWRAETVKIGKWNLTRGERIALYRHSKNDRNLTHILDGGIGSKRLNPKLGTPNKVYKMTEEELIAILQSLTSEEKRIGDIWGPIATEQGKLMAEVYEEKNGAFLPLEDNYYPIEVMGITLGKDLEKMEAEEMSKPNFTRVGVPKNMLAERVDSKKPIYLNDFFYDVNKSVMKAAAYIGLEIPMSNAGRLLYNQKFRAELESRYGTEVWHELEKGLKDIIGEQQFISGLERRVMGLKNNLTVSRLGFNPFTIFKNMIMGLPTYAPYVEAKYLLQAQIEAIFSPRELQKRHEMYSPKFLDRITEGYTRDVRDVIAASAKDAGAFRRITGVRNWRAKFMAGLQWSDKFAVVPGMQACVNKVLSEFQEGKLSDGVMRALDLVPSDLQNLTPADKMRIAYQYADYVTAITQPSSLPEHRSSMSRGSVMEQQFTQYGEGINTLLNLARRHWRKAIKAGDPDANKKMIKALLVVFVLMPFLDEAINMVRNVIYGRWEEVDNWNPLKTLLKGGLGIVFIVRDFVEPILSKAEKGIYKGFDVELPITNWGDTVADAMASGLRYMENGNEKDGKKFVIKSIDAISGAYGIPAAPLKLGSEILDRLDE